ncbi:MAG: AgmX/PglI C-terminal domain-containing protein [Myxococcaceae bacterium]|nr:AgmX/PglI C-terminal domain-containing protein [Myxococcaceae bacterium]
MSAHLTDEQLEAPGEAPHLAECAECRSKVARARARQKLLGGMKPYTLSGVAFSRVEAKLLEHARENPPGPVWGLGRIFALGAFAAVAVLFAVTTVVPLFAPTPQPVVAVPPFEPMTVVFASGQVSVKAGDSLGRDAVLDGAQGTVVLSTGDGLALRLQGGAKLVLGTPTETVRVERGRLLVESRHRGPWVVRVGNHWLRTADTTFEVAPESLELYRGGAVLADNAAFENARQLNGPLQVDLTTGKESPLERAAPAFKVGPLQPGKRLEVTLAASEVEIDGVGYGPSPLSLMTLVSRHKVRAKVGEQWREGELDLATSGTGVVELPERAPVAPVQPVGPTIEADPAAIAASVKAQLPKLRVCHEKWLKVNEAARGKVLMTLTVSPKGKVTRAKFSADEGVPEAVNECLGRAVRGLTLPKSSEEVELEVPVLLGAQ